MPPGGHRPAGPGGRADAAAALAPLVLPDADGRDVRLGDLWRDRTAVIVWLRHPG